MMTEWIYWLGWLAALVVISVSIYVAWKSWFSDRARGRRRCPRCWYDMAYSEGMTCSECGHTARKEKDFSRTRRYWLRGSCAVLVSAIVVSVINEQLMRKSWASYIPSTALIWSLTIFNDAGNDATAQLFTRIKQGKLGEAQLQHLVEKCVRGDVFTEPADEIWRNKYGTILNRIRPNLATQRPATGLAELEELLLNIPPYITLTSRETWPQGSSAQIGIQALNWWPYGSDCRLQITPRLEGAKTETIYHSAQSQPRSDYSIITPPLPGDATYIDLEIVCARRTGELGQEWVEVSRQTHRLPLRIEGKVQDMIQPVRSEEMDLAMQQSMSGVTRWIGGPQPVRFYVNPRITQTAMFNDVAVGFTMYVLHDGEVVLYDETWWMAGQNQNATTRDFGSWSEDNASELFKDADFSDGLWTIRIKGEPGIAFRAAEAKLYWDGEFEIDLTVREVPRLAPPPPNWVEESELENSSESQ